MEYADLLRRLIDEARLFAVTLELTYACNLDCFYCYNDRSREDRQVSLERYLRLLDELHEMQVMNLVLTGGEPLAYPGFFDIGRRARELDFVIRIKTNGHGLRKGVAERLKSEVDPYHLDISIHGATPETHDRQTRVRGSFRRLLRNIGTLQELGFRIKLNCTLTRWNEHEIEGVFALADSLGLRLDVLSTVTRRDDGDTSPLVISPSPEAVLRVFKINLQRAQSRGRLAHAQEGTRATEAEAAQQSRRIGSRPRVCAAGSSRLTIDPFGNVLPCVQWRRPVGSIHRQSVREIWERSHELVEAREITANAVEVARRMSPDGRIIGYCVGNAEAESGSPTAAYPSGRLELEARAKARVLHQIE